MPDINLPHSSMSLEKGETDNDRKRKAEQLADDVAARMEREVASFQGKIKNDGHAYDDDPLVASKGANEMVERRAEVSMYRDHKRHMQGLLAKHAAPSK